jgi:hypothetical protein
MAFVEKTLGKKGDGGNRRYKSTCGVNTNDINDKSAFYFDI